MDGMGWDGRGRTRARVQQGMIVRLQGFDRGVFGGNFHTHNILHLCPGVDTVCYSNGEDYVRGMRYAAIQVPCLHTCMPACPEEWLPVRACGHRVCVCTVYACVYVSFLPHCMQPTFAAFLSRCSIPLPAAPPRAHLVCRRPRTAAW